MPNHKSPAANGNTVPTYLPLSQAARKYNISENVLTRMIRDGRIDAAQLPSGELLVSDDGLNQTKTKEQIIGERFAHLQGKLITISEASDKYSVPRKTIEAWVYRNRYICIADDTSYPKRIDEAEVAYCAEVYHTRQHQGISHGIPLLDEDGLPILGLKRPELSDYRRKKRRIIE